MSRVEGRGGTRTEHAASGSSVRTTLSAATCFIDVRIGPGQARSQVTGVAALSAAAHAVGVRLTFGLRRPGYRQGRERLERGLPSRT